MDKDFDEISFASSSVFEDQASAIKKVEEVIAEHPPMFKDQDLYEEIEVIPEAQAYLFRHPGRNSSEVRESLMKV